MNKIPEGYKVLKKGKSVTVGSRTYKGSCPAELHPDNLKKSDKPEVNKESNEPEINKKLKSFRD